MTPAPILQVPDAVRSLSAEPRSRTAAGAVGVRRLTLNDFRNYTSVRLDTAGRPMVLTGANGAGKTNLLEALSLLAPGRGLRNDPYDAIARDGGAAWAIAAEVDGPEGEARIGTAWQSSAGEARQVKISGTLQRGSGAIARHVRVLWLTPAMDRLFAASAGDRRRFLDRLVAAFDPEHGTRVNQFERAMRERNRLLEDGDPDRAWLSALEQQMAEGAVAIAAARRLAVEALSSYVAETRTAQAGGAFPWVSMAIVGEIENELAGQPALRVEDDYRRRLHDARRLDQAAGRALSGPHRSDLQVTHGPRGMAAEKCSTGEQKALLIGITLAHARAVRDAFRGFVPLLLLDEVVAHLDEARREGLFQELAELGAQAWMTGTDAALFQGCRGIACFVTVEAGAVRA